MKISVIFKWIGIVLSIMILGLLLLFIIGKGMPPVTLKSICFPFLVMVGLILAWKWQRLGSIINIGAVLIFYLIEYIDVQRFPGGPWFFVAALPSIFFLLSSLLKHNQNCEKGVIKGCIRK